MEFVELLKTLRTKLEDELKAQDNLTQIQQYAETLMHLCLLEEYYRKFSIEHAALAQKLLQTKCESCSTFPILYYEDQKPLVRCMCGKLSGTFRYLPNG